MRKFIWGLILVVGAISAYFAWGAKGAEERTVVVHDTIYKDTFLVALRDTVFYDVKSYHTSLDAPGVNHPTDSRADNIIVPTTDTVQPEFKVSTPPLTAAQSAARFSRGRRRCPLR